METSMSQPRASRGDLNGYFGASTSTTMAQQQTQQINEGISSYTRLSYIFIVYKITHKNLIINTLSLL